jgi:glycosyltransferase involved in cell wall biosynthesis
VRPHDIETPAPAGTTRALLCVCNYPANTGYAWDFIESLYAGVAARLEPLGVRTFVAYPSIERPPASLQGSVAQPIELDATLKSRASTRATIAFMKQQGVRALYLTDRPARSLQYGAIHLRTGATIVVHDHSSGSRSAPTGLRRALKWAWARLPPTRADVIIAVSDFVRRRQLEVGMVPANRVVRIWNGITVPAPADMPHRPLHHVLGISETRRVIACACRAAPEKGVPVLLRAFDRIRQRWASASDAPVLVYMGDGPQFEEIKALAASLSSSGDIVLTGYRADAATLLAGADLCAMPSVWEDALPLAVMQPMGLGRAVVASRVGGIPEMIVHGESGLMVPPDDVEALADALEQLLRDPALARRLGDAGRARVSELFTPELQLSAVTDVLARAVGVKA